MFQRKTFRRKKRLDVVRESDNEPGEEASPYTSTYLRLGIVQPGTYVEWASLSPSRLTGSWHVRGQSPHSLPQSPVSEEAEEKMEEDGEEVEQSMDMLSQMRQDEEEEKRLASLLLNKLKEERLAWERNVFTLISEDSRRGDAELIRLLFSSSGTAFVDHRVSDEEWQVLKHKFEGHNLPILCKCGITWSVTDAIVRMLAKKFFLLGETNDEHLIVDATYERLRRVQKQSSKAINWVVNVEKSKEKLEWARSQLMHVVLPPCLKEWEQQIRRTNGPFIVASGVTVADIAIMDFLDQCASSMHIEPLLADHLAVSDLLTFVKMDTRIAVYLEDRNKEE